MDKAGAKWAQIRVEKRRSFEFATKDLYAVSLLTRRGYFVPSTFTKEKSKLFKLNYKVKVLQFMKRNFVVIAHKVESLNKTEGCSMQRLQRLEVSNKL